MREKLAFIDHSYHQKTEATHFLIELMEKEFDVQIFWDHSWNGGPRINLSSLAKSIYKKILFFQLIHYPEQELHHLRNKEVIVCPMYDASPIRFDYYWKKFLTLPKVKFINFSKTLHSKLSALGFPCKQIQYFVPSETHSNGVAKSKGLCGFFWQRTNQITWKQIRKLVPGYPFSSFCLHSASDPPGYRLVKPSSEEIEKYNIKISQWFTEKKDYLDLLDRTDIYFAPRYSEGIGMSFLEAMARGKCVVAPDRPTMNEYITHGETGILYDPHQLKPIDLSNIRQISQNAQLYCQEGYERWLVHRQELLDFVVDSPPVSLNLQRIKKKNYLIGKLEYLLYKLKEILKKRLPCYHILVSWTRKLYR